MDADLTSLPIALGIVIPNSVNEGVLSSAPE
jgi:hypothetical protein